MLKSSIAAALLAAMGMAQASGASRSAWDHASSVARDALMISALGVPAVQGDWTGDLQAGASMAVATGAAVGLKALFPEERPDRSDRKSFPSGHSADAFAAAATLENRYGWQIGLPAFAVASFVATARVEAHKHHWYDCVAGAAVGTGSGLLLTTRRDDRVQFVPWASGAGGGLALTARF